MCSGSETGSYLRLTDFCLGIMEGSREGEDAVAGGREGVCGARCVCCHSVEHNLHSVQGFTEMCSGSKTGSYLRLIDCVYPSTLGLRVIKKKKGGWGCRRSQRRMRREIDNRLRALIQQVTRRDRQQVTRRDRQQVTRRRRMRRTHRNVQRFRGGLVFKAHRLCVSLNSRRESNNQKKKDGVAGSGEGVCGARRVCCHSVEHHLLQIWGLGP